MTDTELTKMLRSSANRVVNYAGDRIEALTAERDHAWAMVAKADTQVGQSLADHMQAKAERDRLREALEYILAECTLSDNTVPSVGAIKYAARAALKEESHD